MHTKWEEMEVLTNFIVVIILQCICASNHHTVYFKHIYTVCQKYLNKAGKKCGPFKCHYINPIKDCS